jgi:hypothetical protein
MMVIGGFRAGTGVLFIVAAGSLCRSRGLLRPFMRDDGKTCPVGSPGMTSGKRLKSRQSKYLPSGVLIGWFAGQASQPRSPCPGP